MAKQKYSNTSSIETNSFSKGMVKDVNASLQAKQNWSHARNAHNNSVDGDAGVIGNEPANLKCGVVPYTIIGFIYKQAEKWYIFSTDDTNSEIGLYDESTCEYTTIVNAQCLNFKTKHLITGAAKENYDCTWQIYFDDGLNPSRTLNVDDIPWVQIQTTSENEDCIIYKDSDVLDCEQLRLAPVLDTPCLKLTRAQDGGQLRNGMYQAYIAYVENDQVVTDYIGVSNLQSLFDHDGNSGSLNIEVTNLDKDYEFYQLVILSNNQQSIVAKAIGKYSTEQSNISIDFIDPALPSVDFTVLFARKPAYEKSDAMYVVNDWLIRQGPTEQFDFNYQPIANQIKTNWVAAEYPQSYFYKGGNKTNFMRDEVYTFFIRWIYNTGERSKSYHIPGRPPKTNGVNQFGDQVNETELVGGINAIDGPNYNFEIFNTASVTSLTASTLEDGGVVIGRGEMAYWQSTERYPATQPEIWDSTYTNPDTNVNIGLTSNTQFDLCGKNIRHHKMPTEETNPIVELYNSSNDKVRLLGVEFSNIGRPKFNDGTFIPNIVGYEILRGSREGAKSVLAKGVFRNMREYNIPDNPSSLKGLYPNYPYNDLRDDVYFHDGTKGVGPAKRTDGCDGFVDSINNFPPISGYSKSVFTFHSPELMFKKPYLNSYEARIYGELHGFSEGYFTKSELHPQNKLIRNVSALLAGIIGIGYAVNAINGTETISNRSAYTDTSGGAVIAAAVAAAGVPLIVYGSGAMQDIIGTLLLDDLTDISSLFIGNVGGELVNGLLTDASGAAIATLPGVIGPASTKSNEKTDAAGGIPNFLQILAGWLVGRQKIAEGAQEIIDVIYNFIKESDFAYKHNSHGELFNYSSTINGSKYRSKVNDQNYIGSSFQVFDGEYKINNLFRPKTTAVSIVDEFNDPSKKDISRYTVGGGLAAITDTPYQTSEYLTEPEVARNAQISMLYGALKFNFQNQYGQIEGVKQVPMRGCVNFIDSEKTESFKYSSELIFAGDTYVGRYTEKVIMPIFSDFLLGQPNQYTHDYLKYVNIPYPRFWMNTQKYDPVDLANEIMTLGIIQTDAALPNDLYYLDRNESSCAVFSTLFSDDDPNPAFAMRYAYMYTHVNGVLDFFTESEINLSQRDWEDRRKDRHYDPYEYNDLNDLFHAEIIKEDNFYKYDYSLSASRFITNLTSFGEVQPRDYDPTIAETCFSYYPKRLIYSLQAQEEAKKDFWRVYLPNNYKDFKDRVSVIKPINKSGAIIFFPYQSPQVFQGLDQLQTDLGTKLTIGDGGLFSQPFQNVVNSDLPNEYGSCESRRTIVNTPLGLFYISQAQGKVFQFTGGLNNIANLGMKWWFNKYLPSVLIKQYPELEGSPLADNPVIGIGCQSIYDINDDIVYFCKKDFSVKKGYSRFIEYNTIREEFIYNNPAGYSVPIALGDPEYFNNASWTVSYDPKAKAWISFHDWHPELTMPSINHFLTTQAIDLEEPYCPPGYSYNPTTGNCEKAFEESAPAVVSVDELPAIISSIGENCLVDIVIAVDTSDSTGGPDGDIGEAERTFVTEFIDNPLVQQFLTDEKLQIGITSWSSKYISMNPGTYSMDSGITSIGVDMWLQSNWFNAGTNIPDALAHAETILNNKVGSDLGDRSADPNFKQYIVFVTDTTTIPAADVGCAYQSATLGGSCTGPDDQFVIPVYVGALSATPPNPEVLSYISCGQSNLEFGIAANDTASISTVVSSLLDETCISSYECNCPEGYTLVYPNTNTPPIYWTQSEGDCQPSNPPICRKVECECPDSPGWGEVTTTGECDNLYLVGDPDYVNRTPLICNSFGLDIIPSSEKGGGIWRHNYRCDLYSNYYGVDYPWEIELIENTGQMVNTVRSMEYQLETYVYKGELHNGCGDDRWHDLDFNFDEAIIHNTEQVSGLLRLELNPKEDPYAILQYPVIGPADIRILYSKEEQKYRFNQFWDVTRDRGEFSNFEQEIFITQLNGYIRDLNANNLDYDKAEGQRKKFRHYYNKVLLRRNKSNNRKMLLKLNNSKLLLSPR